MISPYIKMAFDNVQYLSTTDGDTVPCLSVEEVTGMLKNLGIITEKEMQELNGSV